MPVEYMGIATDIFITCRIDHCKFLERASWSEWLAFGTLFFPSLVQKPELRFKQRTTVPKKARMLAPSKESHSGQFLLFVKIYGLGLEI